MEEISRKAGVGKATIYKWWPSKAYVALDAFLRNVNRMVPAPNTGSVVKDMQEQLRSLIASYKNPAGHILGQFVAEAQIDKEFAALFRERFLKPRREAVGVIFDRGAKRGEIDENLDRETRPRHDLWFSRLPYDGWACALDRKTADRIVMTLFGGLDKKPSIVGRKSAEG